MKGARHVDGLRAERLHRSALKPPFSGTELKRPEILENPATEKHCQ